MSPWYTPLVVYSLVAASVVARAVRLRRSRRPAPGEASRPGGGCLADRTGWTPDEISAALAEIRGLPEAQAPPGRTDTGADGCNRCNPRRRRAV